MVRNLCDENSVYRMKLFICQSFHGGVTEAWLASTESSFIIRVGEGSKVGGVAVYIKFFEVRGGLQRGSEASEK